MEFYSYHRGSVCHFICFKVNLCFRAQFSHNFWFKNEAISSHCKKSYVNFFDFLLCQWNRPLIAGVIIWYAYNANKMPFVKVKFTDQKPLRWVFCRFVACAHSFHSFQREIRQKWIQMANCQMEHFSKVKYNFITNNSYKKFELL